ncbi:hypothetical protein LCGC14_1262490 [marine sediment metagenome]|uniref:Uncharacterized protein n=1 Tax=marine sediment metagenome TaxID=412755 RepID=A0A0F9P3M2_9ZZZZ
MFHKDFVQDQLVMICRLDNSGREYKAKVVGKSISGLIDHYIVEMLEPIPDYEWTHCTIPESCLDLI